MSWSRRLRGVLLCAVAAPGVAHAQPEDATALFNQAEEAEERALAASDPAIAQAEWYACAELAGRSAVLRPTKMARWRLARCGHRLENALVEWIAFRSLERDHGPFDEWTRLRARVYSPDEVAEVRAAYGSIRNRIGGLRVITLPTTATVRIQLGEAGTVPRRVVSTIEEEGVTYAQLPARLTVSVEAPGHAPRRETVTLRSILHGIQELHVELESFRDPLPSPEPGVVVEPARLEEARAFYRDARAALGLNDSAGCAAAATRSTAALVTRQAGWLLVFCHVRADAAPEAYAALIDLENRFGDLRSWMGSLPYDEAEHMAMREALETLAARVGVVRMVGIPPNVRVTVEWGPAVVRGDRVFGAVGQAAQILAAAPGAAPARALVSFVAGSALEPPLVHFPAPVPVAQPAPIITPRADETPSNGAPIEPADPWPFVIGVRLGGALSPEAAYAPELGTLGAALGAWGEVGLLRGLELSAFVEAAYLSQVDQNDGLGPPDEMGAPTDSIDEPDLEVASFAAGLRARTGTAERLPVSFFAEAGAGLWIVDAYAYHGGLAAMAGVGAVWEVSPGRASGFGLALRYLVSVGDSLQLITIELTAAWDFRPATQPGSSMGPSVAAGPSP